MDLRMRALVLRVLCVWSLECERASDAILKQPSTVMWLVTQMGGSTPKGCAVADESVLLHVRGCAAVLLASCLQVCGGVGLLIGLFCS